MRPRRMHTGCHVLTRCQRPYKSSGWSGKGKISSSVTETSVAQTEISVTGLARLFNEHIKMSAKEIGVRRDLGNRTSLVNQAHEEAPNPQLWLMSPFLTTVEPPLTATSL